VVVLLEPSKLIPVLMLLAHNLGINNMADVMNSLFGVTPEALMAQREAALAQQATNFAQLSPMQSAQAGFYTAGNRLAGAAGGLLGAQDPEMAKAAALQGILKQADTTSPEGLATLAKTLGSQGFGAQAMQVMDQARQAQLRAAQTGKAVAEQRKVELTTAQEEKLRAELAALGPAATEEQYLQVVRKYGDPDKIMTSIQTTQGRQDANAARVEAARIAAENRLEVARQQGATQLQIAQMAAQSRQEIAQLTASLKGPSAAVLKAQEKADKMAEGQAGLADTVSVAKTLVNDIADMGGMTTTSKGALANLMTSLGTGTVGQAGARLVGTATQAKRDELNSVRLQLFNAVKEATGMSSTQLNSNVELQTWLKSLGSDTMSKEANLAILNNIENRYLKNPVKKTMGTGTAENPIVLK
jgi:hypothetical protein